MSIRTSVEKVKAILAPGKDYDGKSDLYPFIETASSMVDWIVSNASTYGRTALTTTQAEIVERWLAAHYYKQSDQQPQSGNAGAASMSFRGTTGEGLKSTLYGRTAIGADVSRMLAPIDEGRIAAGTWGGKAASEALSYEDRN